MSAADRRPHIAVRADGSSDIGLGHVMRSMTLAIALVEAGADVTFVGAEIPTELRSHYSRDLAVIDQPALGGDQGDAKAIAAAQPDLVVVDGYRFRADFFGELESANVRYAVIDDNGETAARSPVLILNQNPHASAELYSSMRGTPKLLLGPAYALIRQPVIEIARVSPARIPGTVFISMGGSDPAALTAPIGKAIAASGRTVWIAVGPLNPDREQLTETLGCLNSVSVIPSGGYVHALATCEIAVLAAGTSLWEAAFLRTPTIGVVVADNQRAGAAAALGLGWAIRLVVDEGQDDLAAQVSEAVTQGAGRTSAATTLDSRSSYRAANALVLASRAGLTGIK